MRALPSELQEISRADLVQFEFQLACFLADLNGDDSFGIAVGSSKPPPCISPKSKHALWICWL